MASTRLMEVFVDCRLACMAAGWPHLQLDFEGDGRIHVGSLERAPLHDVQVSRPLGLKLRGADLGAQHLRLVASTPSSRTKFGPSNRDGLPRIDAGFASPSGNDGNAGR